jgi:hypothetical protein
MNRIKVTEKIEYKDPREQNFWFSLHYSGLNIKIFS